VIEEIFATPISLFFWSKLSCANQFLDSPFYCDCWWVQTTLLREDRWSHHL